MDAFVLDLLISGKSLLDYKHFFFPNEYKKNDKIILKYFNNGKKIVIAERFVRTFINTWL